MPRINPSQKALEEKVRDLTSRLETLEIAGVSAGEIASAIDVYFTSHDIPVPFQITNKLSQLEQALTGKANSSDVTSMLTAIDAKVDSVQMAEMMAEKADIQSVNAQLGTKATPELVEAMINQIVGAAPGQLDTLSELATQLLADGNAISSLTAAIASKPSSQDVQQMVSAKADAATVQEMISQLETKADAAVIMQAIATKADSVSVMAEIDKKATPAQITEAINNLVGSAPGQLDTLSEIAEKLQQDDNVIANLTAMIATKASSSDVTNALLLKAEKTELTLKADKADIPLPSTATPSPVSYIGKKGTSQRFALSDHTHAETVKWASVNEKTTTSGVWVRQLPAARFDNAPAIFCMVKSTGSFDYRAVVTGAAAAGFIVTVNFTRRKDTIQVPLPAIVIGAAATNVAAASVEVGTAIGEVTFDIIAAEPSVS